MTRARQFDGGRSPSRGFTLIELLISVFLALIVTTAAMGIYVTQHKQMLVQDEITDMQANIRAAAVELATNIRLTGYNVPAGVQRLEAFDTNPDTIMITYDGGNLRDVQLEWPMPQPSSELRCDGHDISGLYDDDWVFIYDPISGTHEFFLVTQAQYGSSHIQHNTMNLLIPYPAGSKVMKLRQFKYYIDDTDPNHPNLMIWTHKYGAQVYAENITDLQFQYVLMSGDIVDVPPNENMVREIIIGISAKTNSADDEFMESFRTRDINTRVKVRNLGLN